jgi:hemoglobin-like flavoprotein
MSVDPGTRRSNIPREVTEDVMQSYGRCCRAAEFFDDFYEHFLQSSEEIRSKFVNTNMQAQKTLLRQGIMNLVMVSRGMPDTKLRQLGETHSTRGFNIPPHLYDLWVHSLLVTIKKHDPEYSNDTRDAWLQVLNHGIAVIKSLYQ